MSAALVVLLLFPDGVVGAQTDPVPGASGYEWCVDDVLAGTSHCGYLSIDPMLSTVQTLPGRRTTLRVQATVDGIPQGWSDPSREIVDHALPGDLDWDCVVGAPDYLIFAQNFGKICQ